MRVSLLIPCLIDQFHPQVGKNAVRVLKKVGLEVHYPEEQICCGLPFLNSGYWKKTIPIARNTIQAFNNSDIVVAPSGSCVSMIRNHYAELFRDDPVWQGRAQELSQKVYEFSEFLIRVVQVEDTGATFKGKVAYHDSCQVLRGLRVSSEPRRLLRGVRGLELVEMEGSDLCCGFGDIFSFRNPHIARAMVEEKIRKIRESGAEIVTGCEIGCLMHMAACLRQRGIPVGTVHLADILAEGI